jgi:MFS family permease
MAVEQKDRTTEGQQSRCRISLWRDPEPICHASYSYRKSGGQQRKHRDGRLLLGHRCDRLARRHGRPTAKKVRPPALGRDATCSVLDTFVANAFTAIVTIHMQDTRSNKMEYGTTQLVGSEVLKKKLTREEIKTLTLSCLGGALEYYDFIVAIFFTKVLSAVFFPANTPSWLAQVQVFCIFAAGYLIRPIGGAFFSHFGDKIGRKKMFSLSLLFMALPTFLIGCLPDYNSIGVSAAILLLLCRLMQGLSSGGEVPGAYIFSAEHVKKGHAGLAVGLVNAGIVIGVLIGSLCAKYLLSSMPTDKLLTWGWRVPFLLGGLFGLVAVYLRKYLHETPIFEEIRARKTLVKKVPMFVIFAVHKRSIVLSVLATWVFSVIYIVYFLYMPVYFQSQWHFSAKEAYAANTWAIFWNIIGSIAMGWVVDRIGGARTLAFGSIVVLFYIALFYLKLSTHSDMALPIYMMGGFFVSAITIIPFIVLRSFPPEVRFTGFAISWNIAYAVFGGTAPAIISAVVGRTTWISFPVYYVGILCLLGVVVAWGFHVISNHESLKDFQ